MGNRHITVKNDTEVNHQCKVHPVGSVEATIEKLIGAKSSEVFQFARKYSKTCIVSVGDNTLRAVDKTKRPCLKQIDNGLLIIAVEDVGDELLASIDDILESREMDFNWNVVSDEKVKDKDNKVVTKHVGLMMELNKHISAVFGMMTGAVVADVSGSKDAARLATKMSTDFFNNYLKTVLPQLKDTEDKDVLFKLKDIHQTLVSVDRALNVGYDYFCETTAGNDVKLKMRYLHDLLFTIGTRNIFPCLEECGLEVAVPIYIYGIKIVRDLFGKILELSYGVVTVAEEEYVTIFVDNLREMWDCVLSSVESGCEIRWSGSVVKKASLWSNGRLIYVVKSKWRERATSRIDEIRVGFIRSRRYQLDSLYNHPSNICGLKQQRTSAESST